MSAHPASRFLMDFEKGTKPPPPAPAARVAAAPAAPASPAATQPAPLPPLMAQPATPAAPPPARRPLPASPAPSAQPVAVAPAPLPRVSPTLSPAPSPTPPPSLAQSASTGFAPLAPHDASAAPLRPRLPHKSELPPLVLPEMPEFPPAPVPPPPPQPAAVSDREREEYERGFAAGIAAAEARHAAERDKLLEAKAEEIAGEQRAAREAEMGRLRDAIAVAMDAVRAEADAALAAALAPLAAAMVRTAAFEQLRGLLVAELGENAIDLVIRGPVTDCVTLQAMLLRSGISARLEYSAGKEIEVTAKGEVFRTRMDRIISDFIAATPVEAAAQGRTEQPAGDVRDAD